MVFKGFKFGMLLQLAIGPVFVYIFKLASNNGFIAAETGVLAVTFVDALYILLAILGIASFIEKDRVKSILKIGGSIIVALFGLNIIVDSLGWGIVINLKLFNDLKIDNSFLQGLVLTASNPLTILFWAGVFSAKIAEGNLNRKEVFLFGVGAVISTVFFLTFVAMIGSLTKSFIPEDVVKVLNVIVGLTLLYLAIRMFLKKV